VRPDAQASADLIDALRLGLHYPGITTWNARHRTWLAKLKLDHPEQRFAL
jgi:hypothetical protein